MGKVGRTWASVQTGGGGGRIAIGGASGGSGSSCAAEARRSRDPLLQVRLLSLILYFISLLSMQIEFVACCILESLQFVLGCRGHPSCAV